MLCNVGHDSINDGLVVNMHVLINYTCFTKLSFKNSLVVILINHLTCSSHGFATDMSQNDYRRVNYIFVLRCTRVVVYGLLI